MAQFVVLAWGVPEWPVASVRLGLVRPGLSLRCDVDRRVGEVWYVASGVEGLVAQIR